MFFSWQGTALVFVDINYNSALEPTQGNWVLHQILTVSAVAGFHVKIVVEWRLQRAHCEFSFRNSQTNQAPTQYGTDSTGHIGDTFGSAVDINGDWIVVAAESYLTTVRVYKSNADCAETLLVNCQEFAWYSRCSVFDRE